MSSRTLLAGAMLMVCLGATGCTGRQILSMREHHEASPAAPAPAPTAGTPTPGTPPPGTPGGGAPAGGAPAAGFTGPAMAATTDYPKNPNALRPQPPAEFASMKNPLTASPETLAKGKALFASNCAPCHGASGAGDGAAAAALNPKPADFKTPIHSKLPDGYWFWRLTKGGTTAPFTAAGSAMPPWEGTLTPEQRWLVILYEHTFSQTK